MEEIMLSFKMFKIEYKNRVILQDITFNAFLGEITTIIGPSGSGKTSILKALTSTNNDFVHLYDLNGIDFTKLNVADREKFIWKNITFVAQENEFIIDLKISDHIQLIHEARPRIIIEEEIMKELGIEDLLEKYPNELSGGEKSRVSLYLAILKNTNIIILDEPTSSLDEYNTQCVLNVLNKIKKNKIIILSTHDEKIINLSDTIYSIEDKTLVLKKEAKHISSRKPQENTHNQKTPIQNISKILNKMKLHEKRYKKIITFITVVMIGVSAFATGFNNVYKTVNVNMMNQLSSTEMLIYKPSGGYADLGVTGSSEGNEIIDLKELEEIKKIPHVKEVRSRVDIEMAIPFVFMVEDMNPKTRKRNYNLVIQSGEKNIDKSVDLDYAPTLNSYYSDKDYTKEILKNFNEETGIYISKKLAEHLNEDIEQLNGKKLEFDIYIPVYNSVGKAWADAPNGDTFWPNITSCKVEKISLPIAGVLKSSSMGIKNNANFSIYVENEIIMELVDKYKPSSSRICYLIDSDDYKFSIDKKPSDKKVLREIQEEVWTPKSYSVFIDDSTKIESVANEIAHKGFNVSNEYMNIEKVNHSIDKVQEVIKISVYTVTALISMVYIIIKLNNRRNELEVLNYLKHLGIDSSDCKKINFLRYIYNTIYIICLSIVMLGLFVLLSNILHYGDTTFHMNMFIIIIILSTIIELIIPLMIERMIVIDSTL